MLLDAPILATARELERIAYVVVENDCQNIGEIRRTLDERLFSTVQVLSRTCHRLLVFADEGDNGLLVPLGTIGWIDPGYLYPCSEECALLAGPCPRCPAATPASRLPRKPWRHLWRAFLDAVRANIIRQLAKNNTGDRLVYAMGNGFVLAHELSKDEWTAGWENRARARPLIYVHLDLHLSSKKLIVHPVLNTTPYIPLAHLLPSIPQGTPLTLLPYPTPAYFQTTYTGPTSALNAQFSQALSPLACDRWEGPYVVVYIPVENTNGEEKGLSVIYPQRLCLAAVWTSRPVWNQLPALPAQLQPSPVMMPMVPPNQNQATTATVTNPPMSATALMAMTVASPQSQTSNVNAFPTLNSPLTTSQNHLNMSFAKAHAVLSARRMMKDGDPLDGTAEEVSGYVDFVAREREKERERLRESRGRSAAGQSQQQVPVLATPAPPAPVSVPAAIQAPVQASAPAPQTFYPSPPTNPPSVGAQGPVSPGIGSGVGLGVGISTALSQLPQIPQGLPLIAEVKEGRRAVGASASMPMDEGKKEEKGETEEEKGEEVDVDMSGETAAPTTAPTAPTAAKAETASATTATATTTTIPPPAPQPQPQNANTENEDSWMGSFGGLGFDEFRFDGATSGTSSAMANASASGDGARTVGDVDMNMNMNMDDLGFGSWDMGGMGMGGGMGGIGMGEGTMGMDWDISGLGMGMGMGMGWMDQDSNRTASAPVAHPIPSSVPTASATFSSSAVSSTRPVASSTQAPPAVIGGMDFEADFTDDDFSFFDKPAEGTVASSSAPAVSGSMVGMGFGVEGLTPGGGEILFGVGVGGVLEGEGLSGLPGQAQAHSTPMNVNHLTPSLVAGEESSELAAAGDMSGNGGAATGKGESPPLMVDVELEEGVEEMRWDGGSAEMALMSALLPGSLSRSGSGYREASAGKSPLETRTVSSSSSSDKKFAPIPFAMSHRVADGKYKDASGKFAFGSSSGSGSRTSSVMKGKGRREYPGKRNEGESRAGSGIGRWSLPSPPVGSDETDESESEEEAEVSNGLGAQAQAQRRGVVGPTLKSTVPDIRALVERDIVRGSSGSSSKNKASNSGDRVAGAGPFGNHDNNDKAVTIDWYDRATDPRIGVVKKLIGVKRKSRKSRVGVTGVVGYRWRRRVPRWQREWEREEGWGERESEGSDDDDDDEEGADDTDGGTGTGGTNSEDESGDKVKGRRRGPSRPMTPLPEYLPPGPSLLTTQFRHVHLLSLSTPIRGSVPPPHHGASMSVGMNMTGPPPPPPAPSVPTPVSPAAMVGAAAEKSRSAEAAAYMLAREVVENCVWARAWAIARSLIGFAGNVNGGFGAGEAGSPVTVGAMGAGSGLRTGMGIGMNMGGIETGTGDVWPADIDAVRELLGGVKGFEGPLNIGDLYETEPTSSSVVHVLDPPHLVIGKGDAIIHVLPTALRFWEKLGLGPKGGRKNVTAFVLYEDKRDGQEWRQHRAELWLAGLVELYQAKQLGNMVQGTSTFCQKDGLVALRFDSSFRKTLAAFIASLPAPQDSFVFFLVAPISAMSLGSTLLRDLCSAIKKAARTYSEAQILFQLVPEGALLQSTDPSSPQNFGTDLLCCSVYNRILQPVDRVMSRRFFEHGERVRNYFQVPAFTLARMPSDNRASFVYTPNTSLDVVDRHMLLHVGYQVSQCGKWILAACVDQRGEAHDLGVWLTQPQALEPNGADVDIDGGDGGEGVVSDEMYVVGKVWEFAMQFAEKANVEWRIVLSKLGAMGAVELDAWTTHLSTALHSISTSSSTPVHVSVMAVEPSAPWVLLPSQSKSFSKPISRSVSSSSKSSAKTQVFIDASMTTYALYQKVPLPISVPPTQEELGLASNIVADIPLVSPNGDDYPSAHDLSLLPLSSSTLVRVPSSSSPSASSSLMIHLHLLHAAKSYGCSYPTARHTKVSSDESNHQYRQLLVDITQSFHSLSILSCERFRLVGANPLLPFHLAAVEAMWSALKPAGCFDGVGGD